MADSLDRLKSQLLTSGLQQENFALFQVINQLIDYLRGSIDAANQAITGSSGGGGGAGLLGATYLTKNKEVGLPNSLQTIAGAGIQFNDANGRRVISTALPFGMDSGEEGLEGPPGPQGLQGIQGVAGLIGAPGMDGESGEDGPPGPPGIDGKIGVDGLPGLPGISMLAIDGEDGVDGEPGVTGPQGVAGQIGQTGQPGPPGLDGIEGDIGEWGIPGPMGPPGLTGGNYGRIFWFDITDASDIAGYKKALVNPSTNAEATDVTVCAGTGDNLLYSFVTEPGVPAVYNIPPGRGFRHIHSAVTTVGGFVRYKVELYYCNADGTGETLVGSSYSDQHTDTDIDEVDFDFYNLTNVLILPTQRLVWKLYVARVSGPANVSVTTYFEGTTHPSYVESTVPNGATGPQGPMGMQGPVGPIAPALDPEEPYEPMMIPGPAGASATPVAGYISLADSAAPATVNFSTEGAIDWFIGGGSATVPRLQSPPHRKVLGECNYQGFDYVYPGTTFTQGSAVPTATTTQGDTTNTAQTTLATRQGIYRTDGGINYGFTMTFNARTTSRTIRIYWSVFSAQITITARLSDGSTADVSTTVDSGAGTAVNRLMTVVYNSSEDFAKLTVSFLVSINRGSNPNVMYVGATMASS